MAETKTPSREPAPAHYTAGQYRRLVQTIISTDPDEDRQAEKERERAERRRNAIWSECLFDELPDWAVAELEREAAEMEEAVSGQD